MSRAILHRQLLSNLQDAPIRQMISFGGVEASGAALCLPSVLAIESLAERTGSDGKRQE